MVLLSRFVNTAISTHTLTWSVTFLLSSTFTILVISTHTLTWSVTATCSWITNIWAISTHTLTWSVTCIIDKTIRFVKFQLTRSRGAWRKGEKNKMQKVRFQLTRSRGAWHWVLITQCDRKNFNSHAHVERDYLTKYFCSLLRISTHTLTWSVTGWYLNDFIGRIFQLTRSRGAWQIANTLEFVPMHFNSHAHVERDRVKALEMKDTEDFNSHAHVERDKLEWTQICSKRDFNSHAHVERDKWVYFNQDNRGISTHTLTWSVTYSLILPIAYLKISTHTLTWSVTYHWNSLHRTCRFQLTRSRGAWHFSRCKNCK